MSSVSNGPHAGQEASHDRLACQPSPLVMTVAEWWAEGVRRFGEDPDTWRLVCPACGHVAASHDWDDAGAPKDAIGVACVGRWLPNARDASGTGPGPCNYDGNGLNPVTVTDDDVVLHFFAFAEVTPEGGAR
ncbi:MAG: hypothetical protein FWD73_15725 [Polyangiaceae bacterium]|nr:hypothetical protein [Polyangiaceae bacterium]